jgi:activating signal cointegrator 1
MKAITIKQPFATLLALGYKRYETRSWQTKHRGKLAIHAGKSIDRQACERPEVKQILQGAGYESWRDLPTGAVIGIGELTNCSRVLAQDVPKAVATIDSGQIDGLAYKFGDFTVGRYAWEVANVELLTEPILCRGRLSLWEWS